MWLDNDTVRIINSEGIEKKVDLKNNFAEIEFNIIRMFKPEWAKRGPYYLDPPSTEAKNVKEAGMIFDTLKRLKRKYQHYKSAY